MKRENNRANHRIYNLEDHPAGSFISMESNLWFPHRDFEETPREKEREGGREGILKKHHERGRGEERGKVERIRHRCLRESLIPGKSAGLPGVRFPTPGTRQPRQATAPGKYIPGFQPNNIQATYRQSPVQATLARAASKQTLRVRPFRVLPRRVEGGRALGSSTIWEALDLSPAHLWRRPWWAFCPYYAGGHSQVWNSPTQKKKVWNSLFLSLFFEGMARARTSSEWKGKLTKG